MALLQLVNFSKANLHLHVYQLHEGGPVSEELDEEDDITAAQHWILPCSALLACCTQQQCSMLNAAVALKVCCMLLFACVLLQSPAILSPADFQGMWEGLVYDSDIKSSVRQYTFADCIFPCQ